MSDKNEHAAFGGTPKTIKVEWPEGGIYRRMMAVMRDVGAIEKDQRNTFGQQYNYRGIDGVLNALGPAMRKHGIFMLPRAKSVNREEVMTGKDRRPMMFATVEVEYWFMAEDGSSLPATSLGEAFDTGDKAVSKAMSVALRTCLLQTFVMPTHETDPDSERHERAAPEPTRADQIREFSTALGAERCTEAARLVAGEPTMWRELTPDQQAQVLAFLAYVGSAPLEQYAEKFDVWRAEREEAKS